MDQVDAILCRTNAGVIATAIEHAASGLKVKVVMSGGFSQLRKFLEAASLLQQGVSPDKHPELQAFKSWTDVQEFSKTDEGADLRVMVRLVDTYGIDAIENMMENTIDGTHKDHKNDPCDLTVITAHKSKGLEWNRVRIHSDFKPAKPDAEPSDTDLRLMYVAVTRARLFLDATALDWVFAA